MNFYLQLHFCRTYFNEKNTGWIIINNLCIRWVLKPQGGYFVPDFFSEKKIIINFFPNFFLDPKPMNYVNTSHANGSIQKII